jgi:hypothetical protein
MPIYVNVDISYFCENDYRVKAEMIILTIDAAPVWICAESCVCIFLRQFSRKPYETSTWKSKHPELYNTLELSMILITSIHCTRQQI